jgi:hypothetical protein
MKYEKPQKGNPHRLAVNQHIFPAKSIQRFSGHSGTVEVRLVGQDRVINLPADNVLFCAKRRWDQRAEMGYMKQIEDSFQYLAAKVIDNPGTILRDVDNRVASEFFALWSLRFYRNLYPIEDIQLKGITGEHLTKDEEERLEKVHLTYAKGDNASVPSRFMTGLNIQISIDRMRSEMDGVNWGVACSMIGEFLVPDTFSNIPILPISPKIVLMGNSNNFSMSHAGVIRVNRLAISCCRTYFFARRISSCPT